METKKVVRKAKSIKLKSFLVDELERRAVKSNRSFNNLVESILERVLNSENNISEEFKAKIERGHQDYINGNTIKIETDSIWESI